MNAGFLFVPFPTAKSRCADTYAELERLRVPSEVLSACKDTRSSRPREDSFQIYAKFLTSIPTNDLPSRWTCPFKTSQDYPSSHPTDELLFMLWNQLAFYHERIAATECESDESAREIKEYISKAISVTTNLCNVISTTHHSLFNDAMAKFIVAYNTFIVSIWQLGVVIMKGKGPSLLAKCATTCVDTLKQCEKAVKPLDELAKTYFQPIIKALLKYFSGYVFFNLGTNSLNRKNYGEAVGYFGVADRMLGSPVNISYAANISNSLLFLSSAVSKTHAKWSADNQQLYRERVIDPGNTFPEAVPLPEVAPDTSLSFAATGQVGHGEYDFSDPRKPGFLPPSPQPSPPAQPVQPVQPSAPYGRGANDYPEVPPPSFQPYTPPNQSNTLPEWENVKKIRREVNELVNDMFFDPNRSQLAQGYKNTLDNYRTNDEIIENMVTKYFEAPGSTDRGQLLRYISQAQMAYSGLESKLKQ